jgi:hypothetical protein
MRSSFAMKIFPPVIAFLAVTALPVYSAVINIERPPGILIGAPLGLDFDGDTIDDTVVRFYDPMCLSGGSVVSCSNGVTITFASNVELFGSISEGQLIPGFLPEGTLLGSATPATSWTSTGSLVLDLIYRFGSSPQPYEGYLPYAQSLERMYIGFRIIDGTDYRYGYFDVQLTESPERPDVLQLNLPEFNGAYIGDSSQQSVLVSPIPEPSTIFMLIGGSILALARCRKNPEGEQDVTPNA